MTPSVSNPKLPLQQTRRGFVSTCARLCGYLLLPARKAPQAFAQRKASVVPAGFGAQFTDIAAAAGLTLPTIYGGADRKQYILEADGCGCAFLDYDNDGWMDIFLLTGTRLDGNPAGNSNRLYRNNRDGTFTDVTLQAGLRLAGWANSVCVGDYNNDGFEDIFCTYFGQNRLYRNNGDGTFTDVTHAAGLSAPPGKPTWSAGCSFLDYNRDGHLDLFVSQYIDFDLATAPRPETNANCRWKGIPVNCGPRGLTPAFPAQHVLYRNNGDGTFTDVTRESKIGGQIGGQISGQTGGKARAYGMTVIAADFDEDGWQDIYVACDSTPSMLFMNNRDGTFREEGLDRGVALSDDGAEQSGMGVAIGDPRLTGHLDLFKTNFADDSSVLYHNDGRAQFTDITRPSRLGSETRFVSWGTGIADLDNDGNPDILVVTGSVYPEVEAKLPAYPNKSPRIVFRNLGDGRFEQVSDQAGPGIATPHSSRGCAFGDFDNDGDVDVLIVNLNEPPSLLRNDLKTSHHWIKVKLTGTRSNRSGIGARVLVHYGGKVQAQTLTSQSSFFSANDPRLHFGLGEVVVADVEIFWPSGTIEKLHAVPADQLIAVREGSGIVGSHPFPPRPENGGRKP
jgi:hypothetical protein